MSLPEDDPLLTKLRDLPSPSLHEAARDRVLAKARLELARGGLGSRSSRTWQSAGRAAVSIALVLSAALYTVNAVEALGRIYVSSSR